MAAVFIVLIGAGALDLYGEFRKEKGARNFTFFFGVCCILAYHMVNTANEIICP